jgi:ribosome recycling factor
MMEDFELIFEMARENMGEAIDHLNKELLKVRAGKANPAMLEGIMVDYYGTLTPLNRVSNVNSPDARTLSIQPWERKMLEPIERAIINSNIGLTPNNNGEIIIINVPVLTEERRKTLTKQARGEGEHARISIRNARKEANDDLKKLKTDGLPEDMFKDGEEEIQKLTDAFIKKVDELIEAKEQDIMTL